MGRSGRSRLGPIRTVEAGTRVARIEVFFDLVFVYAFYNVTRFVAEELTITGLVKGMLVLSLLWLCWVSHMLAAQRVRLSEGAAPLLTFAGMAAVLGIAVAAPRAFVDGGGVPGPVIFPICYLVIRSVHLWLHRYAARDRPAERRQLLRLGRVMLLSSSLLLLAGILPLYSTVFQPFGSRAILWSAAVLVEYGAGLAVGLTGWRLAAPTHFVERFELIVIVALGELIITSGVGSGVLGRPITWLVLFASVLGVVVTATLWWAYFDLISPSAELAMHASHGHARIALARDGYIYLHFPMISGLILLALGGEKLLNKLGTPGFDLLTPLSGLTTPVMFGGIALYLTGLMAFQFRLFGTLIWTRLVATTLFVLAAVFGPRIPALLIMALFTVVCVGLVTVEIFVHADSRDALHAAIREEREARERHEAEWRRRHR